MQISRIRLIAGISICLSIVLVGLFLRIYFYQVNRSLWIDEARLALNLVDRSYLELLAPLDYDQGAPIGFLILQKTIISTFGTSDYILRLLPLFSGIISVLLMHVVSKSYNKGVGTYVSLGLFAVAHWLVYYSSENKQYSTDVLITLVLLLLVPRILIDKVKPREIIFLGLAGIIGMWISHPALFIWLGIFITVSVVKLIHHDYRSVFWLVVVVFFMGVSMLMLYTLSLHALASNSYLIEYWARGFAPLIPWRNLDWYYQAIRHMLESPAGLPPTIFTIGLIIIGIISFALRRWHTLMILVLPYFLILIASSVKLYPFRERMILFTLPLLFLLIAEGVESIRSALLKINRPLANICSIIIIASLFYTPVATEINHVKSPPMGEDIKPAISYLSQNYRSDDLIYVYYGAQPAFEYYSPFYGLNSKYIIFGKNERIEPANYLSPIDGLRGKQRVWFLFSHIYSSSTVNEEMFILEHLNTIGQKEKEYLSSGASIYLYNLKVNP